MKTEIITAHEAARLTNPKTYAANPYIAECYAAIHKAIEERHHCADHHFSWDPGAKGEAGLVADAFVFLQRQGFRVEADRGRCWAGSWSFTIYW